MLLGAVAAGRRAVSRIAAFTSIIGDNDQYNTFTLGTYYAGRSIWLMTSASNNHQTDLDGVWTPPNIYDQFNVNASAYVKLWRIETTGSTLDVRRYSSIPANSLLMIWETRGFALTPTDIQCNGVGYSNKTPTTLYIDCPAGGAVLAGARGYTATWPAWDSAAYNGFFLGAAQVFPAAQTDLQLDFDTTTSRPNKSALAWSLAPA